MAYRLLRFAGPGGHNFQQTPMMQQSSPAHTPATVPLQNSQAARQFQQLSASTPQSSMRQQSFQPVFQPQGAIQTPPTQQNFSPQPSTSSPTNFYTPSQSQWQAGLAAQQQIQQPPQPPRNPAFQTAQLATSIYQPPTNQVYTHNTGVGSTAYQPQYLSAGGFTAQPGTSPLGNSPMPQQPQLIQSSSFYSTQAAQSTAPFATLPTGLSSGGFGMTQNTFPTAPLGTSVQSLPGQTAGDESAGNFTATPKIVTSPSEGFVRSTNVTGNSTLTATSAEASSSKTVSTHVPQIDASCNGLARGFYPVPGCREYYYCSTFGERLNYTCQPAMMWDSTKGLCDNETKVVCPLPALTNVGASN